MDVFCVHPGSVSQGVELMKDGHILAIAPGIVKNIHRKILLLLCS